MKVFGQFIILLIGTIFSVYSLVQVLSILYGWFVVPQFHLPPLNLAEIYGLVLLIQLLKGNETIKDFRDGAREDFEEICTKIYGIAISYWGILLIGYITKSFL